MRWMFLFLAGCTYHTNGDYLASTAPLQGQMYQPGEVVMRSDCRWLLYITGAPLPLGPVVSPADLLSQASAKGPLTGVSIEEQTTIYPFVSKRCFTVRGRRAVISEAQNPASPPGNRPAAVMPKPAPRSSAKAAPRSSAAPSQAVDPAMITNASKITGWNDRLWKSKRLPNEPSKESFNTGDILVALPGAYTWHGVELSNVVLRYGYGGLFGFNARIDDNGRSQLGKAFGASTGNKVFTWTGGKNKVILTGKKLEVLGPNAPD